MRRTSWIWLICSLCALALFSGWVLRHGQTPLQTVAQRVETRQKANVQPSVEPLKPAPASLVLTNSPKVLSDLLRDPRAVLLENALLDTRLNCNELAPASLRAGKNLGAFIVQAAGMVDERFRLLLRQRGATPISYIPNNSLLVSASVAAAEALSRDKAVVAVLPYEPYYKLKPGLLRCALSGQAEAAESLEVQVLLFPGGPADFAAAASRIGISIHSTEDSPIGKIASVRCPSGSLASLAGLTMVQAIQPARVRAPACDLTRGTLGVAANAMANTSWLGLSGSGVRLAVVDTGVDATQPDLLGRVELQTPAAGIDLSGHGTHVAGIIGGSGASSTLLGAVPGSDSPPEATQYRGMAPGATLYCIAMGGGTNRVTDPQLQALAAGTNVLISNNSWVYEQDFDYDFAAASYDASTRDALAEVSGPQPLLFIFPAGNAGAGSNDSTGGMPGSIASPGTAKNVLTIGALEQPRFITNELVTCANGDCETNQPYLALTDSADQVAAFSGRGNVAPGLEGPFGRFKPDLVAPGTFLLSCRSSQWSPAAGEPDLIQSNLDVSVGPHYCFRSGTSFSSAAAAGMVALIQQYFATNLPAIPLTPALLKAIVINGAQPAAGIASGLVSQTNISGWGKAYLPASLPGAKAPGLNGTNSMFMESGLLTTGEETTYTLRVQAGGAAAPISATLVWTDPPGNPAAALKLVNDLDLVITNLDTGEVFLGNDFGEDHWSTAHSPDANLAPDCVNNVERIHLAPMGTNYSVTVRARKVNVDCGAGRLDAASQDYALVLSSDAGGLDPLVLEDGTVATFDSRLLVVLTNTFAQNGEFGTILSDLRFGSHAPAPNSVPLALGTDTTNSLAVGQAAQWSFFVVTNEMEFTNAAFVLFDPAPLSAPAPDIEALGADVDLYVSQDSRLLDLDPAALQQADRSTGSAVDELVVLTNAAPGPYYIALKCESPFGAVASLAVFFRQDPFWSMDDQGTILMFAVPSLASIGAGNTNAALDTPVFAFPPQGVVARRVVVSNELARLSPGSLDLLLTHTGKTIPLGTVSVLTNGTDIKLTFDDSQENDLGPVTSSAVPDGLTAWSGRDGSGDWILRCRSWGPAGTNLASTVLLYPQSTNGGWVLPGAERCEYFRAPVETTNIFVQVTNQSGGGPLWIEASPIARREIGFNQTTGTQVAGMQINRFTGPPVQPGLWRVRIRNDGLDPLLASLSVRFDLQPGLDPFQRVRSGSAGIRDDALTVIDIPVTNSGSIVSLQAGLRLDHPRIGDLRIALVSPAGTRVLLQGNRGADSTNGMGADLVVSNIFPVTSSGGSLVASNVLYLKRTSGTISVSYDFYEIPDWMCIYYESNRIFDSGLAKGAGVTNINYGPGVADYVTIVMNEGDNSDPDTAWVYSISSSYPDFGFLTFTDSSTAPPVKFVQPPYTAIPPGRARQFVRPETPLSVLSGEEAAGVWRLEILDCYPGPEAQPAELVSAELGLLLGPTIPKPAQVTDGAPLAASLAPFETRWFQFQTFPWTQGLTNCISSDGPGISLLADTNYPSSQAVVCLNNVTSACAHWDAGSPLLVPGGTIYFGLQNVSSNFVNATMQVDAAPRVTALPGAGTSESGVAPGETRFFSFYVSELAHRVEFRLTGLSGPAALLAREGLPLPDAGTAQITTNSADGSDAVVVLRDFDVPLLLSPGVWFLAVTNSGQTPLSFQLDAIQWRQSAPFVLAATVQGAEIVLQWPSFAGVTYHVLSCTNLATGPWIDLSGPLTGGDGSTTFQTPAPDGSVFFRLSE